MDEVLDESIVKTKYESREIPGYLNDFPVNRFPIIYILKVILLYIYYLYIFIKYINVQQLFIIYIAEIKLYLINNDTKYLIIYYLVLYYM